MTRGGLHSVLHRTASGSIRRLGRTAATVALVLLATSCGSPTPTAPGSTYRMGAFPDIPSRPLPRGTASALQAVLDTAVRHGLPGISATVLVAGRGEWTGAAGMADDVHRVTPAAVFGLGSITKTMVAAEIMRLSETGMLGLDDQVADRLPEGIRLNTNRATIRDLLAMRSGIPDSALINSSTPGPQPGRPLTQAQILAGVPPYRTEPGQSFDYSNVNYYPRSRPPSARRRLATPGTTRAGTHRCSASCPVTAS